MGASQGKGAGEQGGRGRIGARLWGRDSSRHFASYHGRNYPGMNYRGEKQRGKIST